MNKNGASVAVELRGFGKGGEEAVLRLVLGRKLIDEKGFVEAFDTFGKAVGHAVRAMQKSLQMYEAGILPRPDAMTEEEYEAKLAEIAEANIAARKALGTDIARAMAQDEGRSMERADVIAFWAGLSTFRVPYLRGCLERGEHVGAAK